MTPGADPRLDLFVAERPRLRALAYRMLGSLSDADDVVQDAWLRWTAVDPSAIATPGGFLTTVTTRLALDRLRAARTARDAYVGTWLPEPVVAAADAEDEPAGTVPMALLLLLERLTPEQRAVYVLREAMELGYADVAAALDRTVAGCRQIMRRAREALTGPPRYAADAAAARRVAEAFRAASTAGDAAAIVALLAENAVLLADGGGVARSALNPIRGADRIARFLLGLGRKSGFAIDPTPLRVNGQPGFTVRVRGTAYGVLGFDCTGGRIGSLYLVVNPHKLANAGPFRDALAQTG